MKMSTRMTIDDIAEALGVSKTTVSRAISGKGRISEKTTERVKTYIKEHNYKPNAVAQSLVSKKTYNIGLVLPNENEAFELPFFQNCMKGISIVASAAGYDIMISILEGRRIDNIKRLVENHKVDGVILTRALVKDESIKYLKQSGVPFVVIGSYDEKNLLQIDNDNYMACKELTTVLIAKGLKRLALFGGDSDFYISRTRRKGYEAAYKKMGISVDQSLIYMDCLKDSDFSVLIENVMRKDIDGILCMDDKIAAEVIAKCNILGINIPKDLRIASFYNSSLLDNSIPAITSISFDDGRLGQIVAKTLINKLEGAEVQSQVIKNYSIILKESTS